MAKRKLTHNQESLLLYLETRAVDFAGRVDRRHMNDGDFDQAHLWDKKGFIRFGRIVAKDATKNGAYWVELTAEAWELVGELRKARAVRNFEKRNYQTTEEKRAS